eukprot:11840211-Heterocapsa_arctica.AAC.1
MHIVLEHRGVNSGLGVGGDDLEVSWNSCLVADDMLYEGRPYVDARRTEGWFALVLLVEVLGPCLSHRLCEVVLAVDDDAVLESRAVCPLDGRSLKTEASDSQ